MIQFDINRFGKLARWTLAMEKRQYLKVFLTWVIVFTFAALFYVWDTESKYLYAIASLMGLWIFVLLGIILMGPSMLFSTMKGRYDMQALLLLPASNLEKYLLRYSKWFMEFILLSVSLLIADGIQYVSMLVSGEADATLTAGLMLDSLLANPIITGRFTLFILIVFIHSLYAVGGTFFRSRKYAWLCTSLTLVAVILLAVAYFHQMTDLGEQDVIKVLENPVMYIVLAIFSVFNFWLSYRLFCRIQLKGRFINI